MAITLNGSTGITTPDGSAGTPAVKGTTSTTAGVQFPSPDTVTISTASTERLRVDSSGNVTVGANLSMGASFLRNRIINGAMQIWQRTTSNTAITNSPAYVADRWYGFVSAVTTGEQITRSTSVPTGLFQYSAAFGRPSGNTNTNSIWFCQNIESVNIYDLSSQTVTLSFYAKTGANYSGGALTVRFATGTTADQSSAVFSGGPATGFTGYAAPINTTQSLNTTWTRYTFTGTLGSGVLEAAVAFAYTPTGTAGLDDNIYITGVQLEPGSIATPFERRQYGEEFLLCQRYCQTRIGSQGSNGTTVQLGYGNARSTSTAFFQDRLNCPMRIAPSLTVVTAANTFYVFSTSSISCTSVGYDISDVNTMLLSVGTAAVLTNTLFYSMGIQTAAGQVIYSAEL